MILPCGPRLTALQVMNDGYERTVEQWLDPSVKKKEGRVGQLILEHKVRADMRQTAQNRAGKVHAQAQAIRNPGQTYHFYLISPLLQVLDHHPVIYKSSALHAEVAVKNETNAH
jgi:hypothetical protein